MNRWLRCLVSHRCPRCRTGAVFASLVRMHRECPDCALPFEREPGYFLGAMYFSYALAVAAAAPVVLLGIAMDWGIQRTGWTATLCLVPLAPWLFRTSRTLWLHFDQRFDGR
ncbi:MAG: hypothetical protein HMLKMBBP_01567 [Planctomycetes bacterium]|nr:hypothetical protein [Planctomycetota bacterium]